jgi:transposase-like protein
MTEVSEPSPHPSAHHRQTKFTPENMRQIQNLIDRGKSVEEIAEIIGVTPGTLKVTCSKLRISLRRPRLDTGTGRRATLSKSRQIERRAEQMHANNLDQETPPTLDKQTTDQEPTVPQEHLRSAKRTSATFAILMRYRGEERTVELPLTDRTIALLAIEAEFRARAVTELIANLITGIVTNDKFDAVLQKPG